MSSPKTKLDRSTWKRIKNAAWYIPMIVAICVTIVLVVYGIVSLPDGPLYDYLEKDPGLNIQLHAASMFIELNKYLVSLSTLLLGGLGYLLNKHKKLIRLRYLLVPYLIAFVLLLESYFVEFKIFSELSRDIASGVISLQVGASDVVYYASLGFWSAICVLTIVIVIFIACMTCAGDDGKELL